MTPRKWTATTAVGTALLIGAGIGALFGNRQATRRPAGNERIREREGGCGMRWRNAVGFSTLALCLCAGDVAAQDDIAGLDELLRAGGVRRGDDIYVTDAGGRLVRGSVIDASAAALSISDGEMTWTLGRSEISRIERHDSVAPSICLGIGAAFAAWTYGWCRIEARGADTCYLAFRYLAPTLAVGGLVGWDIDRRMRKTLYAARGAAQLTVSPLVSPDRAGAMASVTW